MIEQLPDMPAHVLGFSASELMESVRSGYTQIRNALRS